ncbi:MAG: hypothetical protein OHK0017_05460 [Patescibacteria group bacterium]
MNLNSGLENKLQIKVSQPSHRSEYLRYQYIFPTIPNLDFLRRSRSKVPLDLEFDQKEQLTQQVKERDIHFEIVDPETGLVLSLSEIAALLNSEKIDFQTVKNLCHNLINHTLLHFNCFWFDQRIGILVDALLLVAFLRKLDATYLEDIELIRQHLFSFVSEQGKQYLSKVLNFNQLDLKNLLLSKPPLMLDLVIYDSEFQTSIYNLTDKINKLQNEDLKKVLIQQKQQMSATAINEIVLIKFKFYTLSTFSYIQEVWGRGVDFNLGWDLQDYYKVLQEQHNFNDADFKTWSDWSIQALEPIKTQFEQVLSGDKSDLFYPELADTFPFCEFFSPKGRQHSPEANNFNLILELINNRTGNIQQ